MNLLQKLIQIPSISGKEGKIQEFIVKYLEQLAYKPLLIKGNVLVKISGKNDSRCLIFNAHVDTVEPGDVTKWKYLPFSGKMINGKIYGVGASDEKSAIVAFLSLIKSYRIKKPSLDLWFMFVVQEEVDGSGTKDCLNFLNQSNYLGKYQDIAAILGEPTSLKNILIGHKGNVFIRLLTSGKSGHGSQPIPFTEHAIFKLVGSVTSLKEVEKEWQKRFSHPDLGKPTMGIFTIIQGGTNANKFPDSCLATLDIRTTPNLHSRVLSELKKIMRPLHIAVDYYSVPVEPGLTPKSEKVVKVAQAVTKLPVSTDTFSSDLSFFTKIGIPAIMLGPGIRKLIHRQNEYALIKNIKRSIKFYQKFIEVF